MDFLIFFPLETRVVFIIINVFVGFLYKSKKYRVFVFLYEKFKGEIVLYCEGVV